MLTDWITIDFNTLDISLIAYLDRNGYDASYDADHLRIDLRRLSSTLREQDLNANF
ncbi:hypothetical protein [Fodinicola acaciae]|uniref:hypothetical protein n=1 Tax=Fodinicola acaciae TaxID=2681555 RepID=UPI0013D033EB|nr:hypothetical protein [Fodinicola acaciae]